MTALRNPSLYVQFFHFLALGYMIWTVLSVLGPNALLWDVGTWRIISLTVLIISGMAGMLLCIRYYKRKTTEDIFPFVCVVSFNIGMMIALPQWHAFVCACISVLSFIAFWLATEKHQENLS